jgi:large subunit ribosomal protein L22
VAVVKTNERPGTRAVLRSCRMSSFKAREVLDLVRGVDYTRAVEILDHTERAAAKVVAKLLRSAAANAEHNDGLDPEELYVATAYADEGATLKRWRPRARGRATRIRKRTCHITVVLARMPDEQLARRRARAAAEAAERRARRVAGTRRRTRASAGTHGGDEVASAARRGEAEAGAVASSTSPPEEVASFEEPAEELKEGPERVNEASESTSAAELARDGEVGEETPSEAEGED